jgi:glutamate/tyrosine decarboxylase-like PLP-dependent enzyme
MKPVPTSRDKRTSNSRDTQPEDEDMDPADWDALRKQGHRMLDDMLDYLEHIRDRPVWQPIPQEARTAFTESLPDAPADLASVHDTFLRNILPYTVGNAHPGFMGWVHGGGTPVGMLAEMLAAGLNANLGGRDHMPIAVERQVMLWMRELFGFPDTAGGLFVTGTSIANMIGVWIARTRALGAERRRIGIEDAGSKLTGYTSSAAHGCIAQAFDLGGFGSNALRMIGVNQRQEIDLAELARRVAEDRANGKQPFFLAATAGTVDTGAIDDLAALAAFARREKLWFHVDGAFGALAMLAPDLAPRLAGIEHADSIAFDFHKWGQVPYDAGFILVRDQQDQLTAFATQASYLRRDTRGMSAGSPWPCDTGPDLSRGFRALKTWFTFKVHGGAKIGRAISRTCELARYLQSRIESEPRLELLAPASLNIVCFRYRCEDADRVNAAILIALQESGISAPSSTSVNGCFAIRAAIVNHRTREADIDAMLEAVLRLGATQK